MVKVQKTIMNSIQFTEVVKLTHAEGEITEVT